ncbi:(E)-2-((N-methylformamido)methylene)succinate hydrolase [Methylobacterium crusticola]|uniref:(E)-2-((N-methylformamido)methylene)succinate hydrolase n=1 Tax=Methylobacterium crusticola TaxID=1697972 RepID=A0ABQ4QZM0_9HYPH|nr:alpha/beta hydrolase [Methylobacterium crusticola]GJD50773.1 (E)-2-((N-methylformamido)methylene)succinate hydrolase [Methylobacterium crusticola]
MRIVAAVLLALGVLSAPSARAERSIPEGAKSVEVNGYPIIYQETGSGVPLVLVHGSLNDYRIWYAQVPEFAKRYRVISLSLRHYYPEKWDGKGDDFSVTQHAADVAALIQKLGLGKIHLLGHSRGGAVVLMVAKEHPELIKTLILEDASGMERLLLDTPESQKMAAETKELIGGLRRNLADGNVEKAAQEFTDGLGGPGTWAKRSQAQRQILLDNMGTGVDSGERGNLTCADIAKFSFPILTLTGERSPRRYPEAFTAAHGCNAAIPAPVVIPNAAHAMNRENPERFNAVVLEFLAHH